MLSLFMGHLPFYADHYQTWSIPVEDNYDLRTDLAASPIVFTCCLFNEDDIRRGLGSGSCHGVMIPPLRQSSTQFSVKTNPYSLLNVS